jgi:hypothetical protein
VSELYYGLGDLAIATKVMENPVRKERHAMAVTRTIGMSQETHNISRTVRHLPVCSAYQLLIVQEQGTAEDPEVRASILRYRMDLDARDIKANRVNLGPISGLILMLGVI